MRPDIEACIEACQKCQRMCLETAMNFCLEQGGRHVQADHFRLMINCAELCQTCANFMLSGSAMHTTVCAACAEVCEACADSCEQIGDMDACARSCRTCARLCETMSQPRAASGGKRSAQPRV